MCGIGHAPRIRDALLASPYACGRNLSGLRQSSTDPFMPPSPSTRRLPTVRAFLLWLVLACLLPGVLGASALLAYQYRQTREQIEKTTVLTARALMQAADNHLRMAQAVAQTLAHSQALRDGDLAGFHARAREAVRDAGLGTNVVLRDAAGRQILNTVVDYGKPLSPPPAPQQVRPVFETGRPVVSDLFIGPVMRRAVVSVDVPVVLDGQVRYALGVGILPQQFDEVLRKQGLPADWITSIVDRSGTIVARTHAPERFVGQLSSPQLLQQLHQQAEGEGTGTTLEGTRVNAFFSRSPSTGWSVAIGIPQQAAEAVFVQTASRMAAGIALLFALGTLVAWRIGGRISGAFQSLTEAAAQLGAGRSVTPPPSTIQEADEVAQVLHRTSVLLQERTGTLLEADRRKDEFIAILAHELRNPLAPVRTAVEIVRRIDDLQPAQRRACDVIGRQVAHMAHLIDDLLDVSRIARGKMALQRQRCDLAAIVRQTAGDYGDSLQARGLTLVVDADSPPLWVDGDPIRLAQMVANLLSNAQRFTEPGGQVRVSVRVDDPRKRACVSVQDTGIGIAPQVLARLFDPFSQAHQDLARSKGGLGLGLALTRGLAQLHGGTVEAHSEGLGQGARFTLEIPLLPQPPQAPTRPPAQAAVPAVPGALRILVIEDNVDAAQSLADLLTLLGHAVRVAYDGESGVQAALAQPTDVVISDIGLPGAMDGYAVAAALRGWPQLASVRLIALSGYADTRTRDRARAAGFDAHLAKPADLDRLEAALRAA
jgi:signal transduction histidine kinase